MIGVINTRDTGAHWFLLDDTGNTYLGPISSGFMMISDLKISDDSRYLAVLSVGEGHPLLEVIDISQLVQRKTYQVLQKVDPYPGTLIIDSWKDGQLYLKSDMLLTEYDPVTDRVSDSMSLSWDETFALNIVTGRIAGISDGAKNPAGHYMEVLLDQHAADSEKDVALARLVSLHSKEMTLPYLLKVLDQETDPKRMNMLLDMINKLRE